MKRYANSAVLYAALAMIFGVFFREFTKFMQFTGKTNLSIMHTHYFVLGMVFFLILLILEKNFSFTNAKVSRFIVYYHIGLNIAEATFLVRGITQVLETELSSGINASISGIAGIGHIILAVSMILILLSVKKSIANQHNK